MITQRALQGVALTWLMLALSGCDPGAERRAAAIRAVGVVATVEEVTDAVRDADKKSRIAAARNEAHRHALETTTLAVAEGAEAAARLTRIREGFQRLCDNQPESDFRKDRKCEIFKRPRNLADVPADVWKRTREVGDEISTRIDQGASAQELLDWLLQQEDVTYVHTTSSKVEFQIKGGAPTGVIVGRGEYIPTLYPRRGQIRRGRRAEQGRR